MNFSTGHREPRNGPKAPSKTVHGLWIGPELGLLERLTLASFLDAGFRFRLWVYEAPKGIPSHKNFVLEDASSILSRDRVFRYRRHSRFGHGQGSVAGFSDLFRYRLLWQEGGWWSDMDLTLLKSPIPVNGYYFRRHAKFKAVGNLMLCPPKSLLMERCLEDADKGLDAENRDWLLPIRILNRHIEGLGLLPSVQSNSNKDSWLAIRPLLLPNTHPIPHAWDCIHWNCTDWTLASVSSNEILPGSTLAQLLDKHGLPLPNLGHEQHIHLKRKLSLPWYIQRLLHNRWHALSAPE